jgi:acetoin utilization deacetylase AcuC-like enzyme
MHNHEYRVLSGRSRNAFCIVRPPGHHAGVNGLLENSDSCGFCIFNNVAIGALHALSERHQVRCQKVAIVDIDAHHGNGTEEIVRRAHDSARLFFFSIHLYDNPNSTMGKYTKGLVGKEWSFYPGTGDKDDMAHNIINVPLAPLWREREVSTANSNGTLVSAGGNVHNTRNRAKKEAAAANAKKDVESFASESDQSSKRISPGKSGVLSDVPSHYLFGTGRKAYRRAIRTRLLPSLRAFNPDLILISAGFDACVGDVGNAKHMAGGKEMAGIDLDPEDYAWTTRKVCKDVNHRFILSFLREPYYVNSLPFVFDIEDN